MQARRIRVDIAMVNPLTSSTIKVGPFPQRLEGTYRNRPVQFAAWVGCVAVVPIAIAAMTLWPEGIALAGLGAILLGALVGAVVIGQRGVRPRLEVSREGVVVVNPDETRSLTWAQIRAFECRDSVVVLTDRDEQVVVSALPTRTWGEPVNALAERLNARLTEARG